MKWSPRLTKRPYRSSNRSSANTWAEGGWHLLPHTRNSTSPQVRFSSSNWLPESPATHRRWGGRR